MKHYTIHLLDLVGLFLARPHHKVHSVSALAVRDDKSSTVQSHPFDLVALKKRHDVPREYDEPTRGGKSETTKNATGNRNKTGATAAASDENATAAIVVRHAQDDASAADDYDDVDRTSDESSSEFVDSDVLNSENRDIYRRGWGDGDNGDDDDGSDPEDPFDFDALNEENRRNFQDRQLRRPPIDPRRHHQQDQHDDEEIPRHRDRSPVSVGGGFNAGFPSTSSSPHDDDDNNEVVGQDPHNAAQEGEGEGGGSGGGAGGGNDNSDPEQQRPRITIARGVTLSRPPPPPPARITVSQAPITDPVIREVTDWIDRSITVDPINLLPNLEEAAGIVHQIRVQLFDPISQSRGREASSSVMVSSGRFTCRAVWLNPHHGRLPTTNARADFRPELYPVTHNRNNRWSRGDIDYSHPNIRPSYGQAPNLLQYIELRMMSRWRETGERWQDGMGALLRTTNELFGFGFGYRCWPSQYERMPGDFRVYARLAKHKGLDRILFPLIQLLYSRFRARSMRTRQAQ